LPVPRTLSSGRADDGLAGDRGDFGEEIFGLPFELLLGGEGEGTTGGVGGTTAGASSESEIGSTNLGGMGGAASSGSGGGSLNMGRGGAEFESLAGDITAGGVALTGSGTVVSGSA